MGAKAFFSSTYLLSALLLGAAGVQAQEAPPTLIDESTPSEAPTREQPSRPGRRALERPRTTGRVDAPETDAPGSEDTGDAPSGPPAVQRPPAAKHLVQDASAPKLHPGEGSAPTALKPLLTPTAGDAEVMATWERWHRAQTGLDFHGADSAQRDLLTLKGDMGVTDFEPFAAAFLRASDTRREARDPGGATALAATAVALAPDLPYAHLGLAEALFRQSPFSPGPYGREILRALESFAENPRYGRPLLGDVAAAVLFALTATGIVVIVLMFIRRVRYLLHDLHHSFPKPTAPWQSAALLLLMLSLPVLFRLGLVPVLLTLFAAVTLYLEWRERVLCGLLLMFLTALPWAGSFVAERTGFAGTPAEEVYLIEEGGLEAQALAAGVRKRLAEDKAEFQEVFALARYEARRGRLDDAIAHAQHAATQRTNDPRLLTNLAVAMMTRGDAEGAAEIYLSATQADPTLAAAYFDLAKLYARRASTLSDASVGLELDRAQNALTTAQRLDESLLFRVDPPPETQLANRLLISPGLRTQDLLSLAESDAHLKVLSELSVKVLGDPDDGSVAWAYGLAALMATALGFARRKGRVALACEKCGRPVCRRCDPELSAASKLCNQCVYAFTRANAVAPAIKVRKQLEVHRFQTRRHHLAYVLGALCSGLGHLFWGLTLSGVTYLFLFFFAASGLILREGVLRAPFGPGPFWFRTLPMLLLLMTVYAVSLRGLLRTQAR